MVPAITTQEEDCPKHGTRDKWDRDVNQSVPLVPCPTNETGVVSKSILDVEVSCFADYKSPDNPRTVNLLKWLTSAKYRSAVELIRATTDKKERDRTKATLPAITPSGVFARREASALIAHSGFICLDIDYKGNEDIANYAALKEQLCRIPNVAYCGQSVSGTGYFVLIPITEPSQHGNQFRALREIFQKRFGIRIDDTPDVSRLRGYSYDPEAYFNHQATPFSGIYVHQPIAPRCDKPVYSFRSDNFADIALQRCIRLIEEASDGQKHAQLNKASYTAGGYIAGGVLDEAVAITALENAIGRKANVADPRAASRTIRDGIADGKQNPIRPDDSESTVPMGHGTMGQPSTSDENRPAIDSVPDKSQPLIARTITEQLSHPGSILKPDESQLERLTVEPSDTYPCEWDEPSEPGAQPTIRVHNSASYFRMQREHPDFSRLGLASLNTNQA